VSRFRLTIESNLDELFLVSMVVQGVCDHLGMGASQASAVELCAVEAVTNAIKHAYRNAPGRAVSLEVSFTEQRVDLDVVDQGLSMPEEQISKLSNGSRVFEFDPDDLRTVPEGGMGLQIIRQEMDQASYSTKEGVNRLRLTKFLRPVKSEERGA
jgi:serine/threonine-protein kinase RsbW